MRLDSLWYARHTCDSIHSIVGIMHTPATLPLAQYRRPCRAGRQSPLATLVFIWFLAGFAPAVCIIHCNLLASAAATAQVDKAALSTGLAAAEAFQPAIRMASATCVFLVRGPSDTPALPPASVLPRVQHDAIVIIWAVAPSLLGAIRLLQPRMHLLVPWAFAPLSPPPKPTH